ncbi:MAG: phospholipid carrier-dependent glycosyltransferase, partial [Planctomycetaceae bacterium]|nr:phospholipid carrier-dependent glycosyltransferase [Planctomycetaceae bacterium]
MASRKLYLSMWLATIAIAFLVRSGVGCYWQSQLHAPHAFGAFEGDSHAYWVLGLQILEGKPYRYGDDTAQVFRAPGYPLMLAGMFAVLGKDVPVLMARHLNAVWGTVTVILAGCLAGLLFGGQVALIAGILVAIYPGSIVMGSLVLTEAPFCPWMLLQLICWLQAVRSDSSRSLLAWSLLGGTSAGIAVLIRPSWFLF